MTRTKMGRTMANRLVVFLAAMAASILFCELGLAATKATRTYNGAIAYHRDSASYGFAVNRPTAREAQVEALKQCGHPGCEVVAKLRNNCGVVVNGPQHFFIGTGATRQEAETKAARACGARCEAVVWACTR
jgi:hypothetical protein